MANNTLRNKIKHQEQLAEAMLEKIAKEHLIGNPNAIMRVDETVVAFGRYAITKGPNGYQVNRGVTPAVNTLTSRVALSWCIADKYGKNQLCHDLIALDHEIARIQQDINIYKYHLNKTTTFERHLIVNDRLTESLARLKYKKDQLDKCLNSAKYWQEKGFNDETARLRLKTTSPSKSTSV
jgi:hypothetical protein